MKSFVTSLVVLKTENAGHSAVTQLKLWYTLKKEGIFRKTFHINIYTFFIYEETVFIFYEFAQRSLLHFLLFDEMFSRNDKCCFHF